LLGVLVLMAFDYPNGTWTIASIPLVALLLVAGWKWLSSRARRGLLKPTIPSVTLTRQVLEKGDN
ncbi:L-asparagine permease, partial [Burkholderia sp. Bp9131]